MSRFFTQFTDLNHWFSVLLAIPGMLAGLTFHEFAHAWVANRLGDPTAKTLGRLTLNPLKHLDIIGTLALLLVGFGWARPVPINPDNFKNPRAGTILVSIAGPLSNIALAVLFALSLRILSLFRPDAYGIIAYLAAILFFGVFYNFVLAFFNIVPIPPLDGSQILTSFLPLRNVNLIFWLQRYGFIILLLLIASGILWPVIILPSRGLTLLLAGSRALNIMP